DVTRGLTDTDLVARLDHIARDVDHPAVHLDVTVTDELTRLPPARRERETVHDVVQPALPRDQQVLTRHARPLRRTLVQPPEVTLRDPVDPADLLLLAKLLRILRRLATPRLSQTMLAGRIIPTLDRTLVRITLRALQEKLLPLPTTQLANRTGI